MPQRAATPPLAQNGDSTVYLVLDDFGALGSAYRETDAAKADLTTVVADLLSDIRLLHLEPIGRAAYRFWLESTAR